MKFEIHNMEIKSAKCVQNLNSTFDQISFRLHFPVTFFCILMHILVRPITITICYTYTTYNIPINLMS